MRILVTGGCGFIGSHLTDALVELGHDVTVFDRVPAPEYQNPGAEYVRGDICEPLDELLSRNFDAIYHFAAEVGSGLSMAEPQIFVRTNSMGTANLLEAMRRNGKFAKVLVASSATVYGEATYKCPEHGVFYPDLRPVDQLERSEWEVQCGICGADTQALPIAEERVLKPASIYGQTKLDQEVTCLLLGRTWGFPAVAFRLFGVFGPRQSLGNPYTGVLALFGTSALAGLPIMHYEDGQQNKGYILINDVVDALILALSNEAANGLAFNIGTETPATIKHIAEQLVSKINPSVEIISTGKYRASDTRHSWCDNSLAQRVLGWQPAHSFEDGMDRMIEWLKTISQAEIGESVLRFRRAEQHAKSLGLEV